MESLEFQQTESPSGALSISVKGALTLKQLFEFQDLIRRDQSKSLILDLSAVSYMDSAALGAILGAYASCERTGRGFAVAGVSPRVLTLFEVAGVDKLLPLFDSVEAAEKQLSSK